MKICDRAEKQLKLAQVHGSGMKNCWLYYRHTATTSLCSDFRFKSQLIVQHADNKLYWVWVWVVVDAALHILCSNKMGLNRQVALKKQLKHPTNLDNAKCLRATISQRKHTNFEILQVLQLFSLSVSGPQHNKTVVCYISTWAVYRPGRGSFSIDNFDPNLCTIAIYAFAGLDPVNDAIRSLGKPLLITSFN